MQDRRRRRSCQRRPHERGCPGIRAAHRPEARRAIRLVEIAPKEGDDTPLVLGAGARPARGVGLAWYPRELLLLLGYGDVACRRQMRQDTLPRGWSPAGGGLPPRRRA